jgi:hypothetical protein
MQIGDLNTSPRSQETTRRKWQALCIGAWLSQRSLVITTNHEIAAAASAISHPHASQ